MDKDFAYRQAAQRRRRQYGFFVLWQSQTQKAARVCNLTLRNYFRLCRLPFFIYGARGWLKLKGEHLIGRFNSSMRNPIKCPVRGSIPQCSTFYGKVSSLRSSSLRKPIRTSEYQETEDTSGSYRRPCGLSTVMARKRFLPLRLKSIFTGYSSALDCLASLLTLRQYPNSITGYNG